MRSLKCFLLCILTRLPSLGQVDKHLVLSKHLILHLQQGTA